MTKQLTFILIGLAIFSGIAKADSTAALPRPENPDREKIRSTEEFYLKDKISELERRLSTSEDEIRYLKDKTRDLDRWVEDLRHSH